MFLKKCIGAYYAFFITIISISCTDAEEGMYKDFTTENLSNVLVIDTVSINAYTTKLDSIVTSNTGFGFVGTYKNENFGSYNASTYLQFSLPPELATLEIDEDYKFDSIALELVLNDYVGDTTEMQNWQVWQLLEQIEPADDDLYLYNNSEIAVSDELLGEASFYAKPTANEKISIRLNDNFGQAMFNEIRNGSSNFETEADFLEYFSGIYLSPSINNGNTLLRFNTTETISLKIFYRLNDEFESTASIEFALTSEAYHFTNIDFEPVDMQVASIDSEEAKLSSSLTDDQTYISGGIGLMTRIEFPYLQILREDIGNQGYILGAKLIIEPVKGTYQYATDLPTNIEMYVIDEKNRILNQVFEPYTTTPQYGDFSFDGEYYKDTYYEFDLTEYFIETGNYDPDEGFLLTIPFSLMSSSFENMLIASPNNNEGNMYLELYYVYVNQ